MRNLTCSCPLTTPVCACFKRTMIISSVPPLSSTPPLASSTSYATSTSTSTSTFIPSIPKSSVLSTHHYQRSSCCKLQQQSRTNHFSHPLRRPRTRQSSILSNRHNIRAKTTSATAPSSTKEPQISETFTQLYSDKVPSWLLQRLSQLGFETPTLIQRAVLQHALPQTSTHPGQDVVIHAHTGSGKTLAYLLPAISAIDPHRSCIQALVVVPTQELGMQVYKLLRRLTSAYTGYEDERAVDGEEEVEVVEEEEEELEQQEREEELDSDNDDEFNEDDEITTSSVSFPVLPMLNKANLRRQKLQLRQTAPRIIVGNPHRIAQLVSSGRLRLDLLKVLVVDEFDACLGDTSTTSALQTILSVRNRERERQTILASATVPQHRHFLRQCVRQHWTRHNIRHVWLDEDSGIHIPPSLKHEYALVSESRKKIAALRSLITFYHEQYQENMYSIVFVMAQRNVDGIVNALNYALQSMFSQNGEPVVGIYNDMPVAIRKSAVSKFRSGQSHVLVGTDVAARGLDFTHVTHVFHFDLPTGSDGYLHRAGRAGRLGRPGTSVVMVVRGEEFVVTRMANTLGINFDRVKGKQSHLE